MAEVTIYHNPRCSKSRQTLELLRERGIEPTIVEYLKTPPSRSTLDALLRELGKEPLEVMRTKDPAFKQLGLSTSDDRSRQQWIDLMVTNPVLIERPIVACGNRAALGRPPERVLNIL